ncbi:MAG: zinc-dependent alcohol dehydrogenase family protein [Pseudomonadota bacterium]
MRAMILEEVGSPLNEVDLPIPEPDPHQIRVRVAACGVCRTDLHLLDGELPDIRTPVIPGHEIVGYVDKIGQAATGFSLGDRVGIPWLGHTCGTCRYCNLGLENLCDEPGFTGYTLNGGYAEYTCADARYCFPLPEDIDDLHAAPLLCAGLIGYRSLKAAGDAQKIGIFGYGGAAHIVAQVIRFQGREFYAFTRKGDQAAQDAARRQGAIWAGASDESPPDLLDAAILFAPVGSLVPFALKTLRKGGHVVCGGIHMSDIPGFPYADLWGERRISSIANLTRQDGVEFLELAGQVPVETDVHPYPLREANAALEALRRGAFTGAAVLVP